MKSNRIVILAAVVATSLVALPSQSQDMRQKENPPADQTATKGNSAGENLQKADNLIGMEVTDSQDHRVGTVNDLLIDLPGGRIAEVLLSAGVPSMGTALPSGNGSFVPSPGSYAEEKLTGVPPACFAYDASGKSLRLNRTRDELRNAPTFTPAQWKEAAGNSRMTEVYQRYGLPTPSFGNLELATLVQGQAVKNGQDQKLGRVHGIVVDLSAGRVNEVILSSGGFLGIKSELTAEPPQSFFYDSASDKIMLNLPPASLKNAPHFKSGEWRENLAGQWQPAPDVAESSGRGEGSMTAPSEVQPGKSMATQMDDSTITSQIQQKIRASDDLTDSARNVQIDTRNGKVTLNGTVDKVSDKQKLSEIAASVVPPENVNNQVNVSTASALTSIDGSR